MGPSLLQSLRRFGPLLLLGASVAFAAGPSPGEGLAKPWEADAGLEAMARLHPGLQRNHVALYFGGEIRGQGLGLPGQDAMEGTFDGEGSLTLTFRLPALSEPLHFTVPGRGVGYYAVGPRKLTRARFAEAENLEGFMHFERLDAQALSGWFFLRVRSEAGEPRQTFGGAFREVSP